MIQQNQYEPTIFSNIVGIGKVHTPRGYRDVIMVGYFEMYGWTFIVHHNVRNPSLFTISEASTGLAMKDDKGFVSVEEAMRNIIPYLREKRLLLTTAILNRRVETQTNLLQFNRTFNVSLCLM